MAEQGFASWPQLAAIRSLTLTDSPRLAGENSEHTALLAALEVELPPILVHRSTMRVIDGMHRVRAALLNGRSEIAVTYFDGDEDAAYLMGVQANLAHGLPLSLADRREAARRVMERYSEWSDRAIAEAVGLSADAVAAVRRRVTAGSTQLEVRVGRDGRVRPVDPAKGRLRASRLLAARPDASLREVAREAGIAVGTARDVRERIRRGADPIPVRQRAGREPEAKADPLPAPVSLLDEVTGLLAIVQSLKQDPSLRFTETGRRLLRWLDVHALREDDRNWVVAAVPPHCADRIAELARGFARTWQSLADTIDLRQTSQTS
ncbi:MAG TPA: ParB N-terminal domain-containing protein [Actinophytocola sp.]|uniref:ParB N-terminal domain-containing protein n=1 Tax=Actinophytocola sp. TaxID=1872138 RepID=UPI002DBDAD3F|nr:ParB N-terminal domain-containing protein [Actinophytocola sp.]HEU5474365.1 ParB N-terminal domain-containing protein [Actinophytocola sp.]